MFLILIIIKKYWFYLYYNIKDKRLQKPFVAGEKNI